MNKFKEVAREEFDAFIESYPNKLDKDVFHAFDPPLLTYNDFTEGKVWPESIVAKRVLHSAWNAADEDNYSIKEN